MRAGLVPTLAAALLTGITIASTPSKAGENHADGGTSEIISGCLAANVSATAEFAQKIAYEIREGLLKMTPAEREGYLSMSKDLPIRLGRDTMAEIAIPEKIDEIMSRVLQICTEAYPELMHGINVDNFLSDTPLRRSFLEKLGKIVYGEFFNAIRSRDPQSLDPHGLPNAPAPGS